MLTLDTPVQVGAFSAAAEAFAAVSRLTPPDPRALAAAGTVVALLAPSYQDLSAFRAAAGLAPIEENDYVEMLRSAQGFALSVATAGETEH